MRLYYRLHTKEALVLSQSTATTNNHLGLDYIPGSAILGAIASQLYPHLSEEDSFALFHSGACRFGPAYPLVNNEIALPIPASWHGLKQDRQALSNHAAPEFIRDDSQQYTQRRQGYISHRLDEANVKQGLTTRTALDEHLRVREKQLYTYTTLEAGQQFGGWVDIASEVLMEHVRPLLNAEMNVGRSRSSEFGRVQLFCSTEQPDNITISNLDRTLVLWCLSDAQCFNQLGIPSFTPEVAMLHPELSGNLNAAKSFIRTRQVRRFNRARGGLDSEQHLIAAGSVLVYDLDEPASDAALEHLATHGIGANRQQGLGWIAVNPAWAHQATPKDNLFDPIVLAPEPQSKTTLTVSATASPLVQWVQAQWQQEQDGEQTEQIVQRLHQALCAAYENARRYNNLPDTYQAGPSSSQWRRLDELVKNTSQWQKAAFDGSAAICKAQNDELGWGLSWQQDNKMTTFADFVQQHLGQLDHYVMRRLLEQLCRFDPSSNAGLKMYKQFSQTQSQGEQK